ncbi:MAG: ABC transporter permease, partial [Gemmatimonas sp.]
VFAQTLLVEASIGFLGLGDPNAMSWGLLAGQAQPFLRVAWWLPVFPGLAISMAVLGVNLLTDAFSTTAAGR